MQIYSSMWIDTVKPIISRLKCPHLTQYKSNQNPRLSPISQTSNTPSSGISCFFSASFNFLGGSRTSSSVSTHVPQCIPRALRHLVSWNIRTESCGLACIGLMIHRGWYAPMGIRPRSKGPRYSPTCLKAGHMGRSYSGA